MPFFPWNAITGQIYCDRDTATTYVYHDGRWRPVNPIDNGNLNTDMNTRTKFGVPTGGQTGGIIQPKTKHRFRVRFFGFGGLSDDDSLFLTQNIARCERPTFRFGETNESSPIVVTLRDDLLNHVGRAVTKQMRTEVSDDSARFDVWIETLDGSFDWEPVERWRLTGCRLVEVGCDEFDYSTADPMQYRLTIAATDVFPEFPTTVWGMAE